MRDRWHRLHHRRAFDDAWFYEIPDAAAAAWRREEGFWGIYVSEAPLDCAWAVYGRDDDYRASCAKDGCVTNNRGMILGYLTETQAGSASEEFLGELEPDATGSALNALDGQDTHICTLHLDGCRLVSLEGSTLCEVDRSGRILGPRSQVLGEVRPFSYAMQREVALLCGPGPGVVGSGA